MRGGPFFLLLGLLLGTDSAHAACNIIPSASKTFRGAVGTTDRPFAGPGDFVEVGVQPSLCDGASPGLSPVATDHVVTLVFAPSVSGGAALARNVVVLAPDCGALSSALAACEARIDVEEVTCQPLDASTVPGRLRFRFPDTDTALAPAGDGRTYAGPVSIAITAVGAPLPCTLASTRCASTTGLPGLRACVDELFQRDGTCRTTADLIDPTFGHFTALPPSNDYAGVCTSPAFPAGPCLGTQDEVRMAVDRAGNLLIPIDWRGVLVQAQNVPVPRLLRGSSPVTATVNDASPIRIPGQAFLGSYTPEGALLPPIFEPKRDPDATTEVALFGSADAPHTVLRLARRRLAQVCVGGASAGSPCASGSDCASPGTCTGRRFLRCSGGSNGGLPCSEAAQCPSGMCGATTVCASGSRAGLACASDPDCPGGECGPALFEFRGRQVAPTGPFVIPQAIYNVIADDPVPLEGLAATEGLFTFTQVESIANAPLNDDADQADAVLTIRDRDSGQSLPIGGGVARGRAVAVVSDPPFAYPAVAGSGNVVAFLESEGAEGNEDANGNLSRGDAILRVYRNDPAPAVALAPSDVAVDVNPLIDGRSLAVSGTQVVFRTSEARSVEVTTRLAVPGGPASFVISRDAKWACPGSSTCFNLVTGASVSMAIANDGTPADSAVTVWGLSHDGRYVVITSGASNLLAPLPDANPSSGDVFVRDRDSDEDGIFDETDPGATSNELVHLADDESPAGGEGDLAAISSDGSRVAFRSTAANLVPMDTNGASDIFIRDRVAGTTVRVNPNSAPVSNLIFSGDGYVVAYCTTASLDPADTSGVDFYVENLRSGTRQFIDVSTNAGLPFCGSFLNSGTSLSDDGRLLTTGRFVFSELYTVQFDTDTGVSAIASISSLGAPTVALAGGASADGRFVSFSAPDGTTPDDGNGSGDVYLRDMLIGATSLVSRRADGSVGTGWEGLFPGIAIGIIPSLVSGDGATVVFPNGATDLVPGDTNGTTDIFVRGPGTTGTDTTGDLDFDDTVLEVLDASTGPPSTVTSVCPAGATSVSGGRVAFLRPEAAGLMAACPGGPDLNGDSDTDDEVAFLYSFGGTPQNLFCAATAVSLSPTWVGGLVSEAAEETDLDGDTDTDDLVLFVHRAAGPFGTSCTGVGSQWINTGVSATTVRVADVEGPGGSVLSVAVALGSDGDLRAFTLDSGANTATPIAAVQKAAVDFVIGDALLAFRVSEDGEGAGPLNGDGDTDDTVLFVYDFVTGGLVGTEHPAVTPCRLSACDARLPYKVTRDTVKFLTFEGDENADLNNDADLGDLVIQSCNARADGAIVTIGAVADAVTAPSQVNPLVDPVPAPSGSTDIGETTVFVSSGRCIEPDERDHGPCVSTADCPPSATCEPRAVVVAAGDADADGITDELDDCPTVANTDQADADGDGLGDPCDLATCENGVLEVDEPCDDGNATSGDGCDVGCSITACGNGVVTAGEQCDDGNQLSGDGCDTNCTPTACGNGIPTAGEQCDDGNGLGGDGCDPGCIIPGCGNGNRGGVEECDDGNPVNGDGCDANCRQSACGNEIVAGGEDCDDGNVVSGDGCDANCAPTGCGTGVVTAGEACDDGNNAAADGCSPTCTIEGCPATPATGCLVGTVPAASSLAVVDVLVPASDKLSWKWTKGQATTFADFGNPSGVDGYLFCVYAPSLLFEATIPAGGSVDGKPTWKPTGLKGFKYKRKDGAPHGIGQVALTAGVSGKAKLKLKAKGILLTSRAFGLPATPVPLPLLAQLQSANGRCWESTFSGAVQNAGGRFKAKSD